MSDTPKQVLVRARNANLWIDQIRTELAQLEQELHTLKSVDYSRPVVKLSSGRGDVETTAVRIAERHRQLEEDLEKQLEARYRAMELISTLPSARDRVILFHRYILAEEWPDVAKAAHYERRYCIKLSNEAIKKLTPENTG